MTRLVERLDERTAVALICPACGWKGKDGDPASGLVTAGHASCPSCEKAVEYEYDLGERCANCGKMDDSQPLNDVHGSYCSRPCQLQSEYARQLQEAS